MVKTDRFTFKLDREDRRLLGLLAWEMRRTQSDTLRRLMRASIMLARWGLSVGLDGMSSVSNMRAPFGSAPSQARRFRGRSETQVTHGRGNDEHSWNSC